MFMGLWSHSIKSAAIAMMVVGCMLPGCQKQAGQPQPAGQQPAPQAAKTEAAASQVIATTNNGAITLEDVRLYHQALTIPSLGALPAAAIDAKTTGIREAALWIAANEAAYAAMKQDSPSTFTQMANEYVEGRVKDVISKYLIDSQITSKLDPVSPQQLAAFYNEHKNEYRIPFGFKMRHLIMTTYEPYTVLPGDTLESIAERVSGGADKANMIRADVPGRPPRREDGKEFKPLVDGEKLFVPMDEAKAEEVHQKLLKALDDLKSGKTFEQVARDKSEGGNGGEVSDWMPTGTTEPQMLPEILEAARKTPVGGVSEPFRTRHGWQAIQVVDKREESFRPLEEVRFQMIQEMQEDQRKQLNDKMCAMLLSQPGVTLHTDRVTSGTEPEPDMIIAETSPTVLRWEKISTTWDRQGQPTNPEALRGLIQTDQEFMQALIDKWAKARMSDPNSELSKLLAKFRIGTLGSVWIRNMTAREAQQGITDEELKKFYEENKEQYRVPDSLKLTIMERRLSSEERRLTGVAHEDALKRQVKYIAEDLSTAKNPADFRTAASSIRVLIEGPEPPMTGQTIEVPMGQLPENMRARLEKVEAGKWTEPFVFDDKSAIALLVDERIPAGIRPFDSVKEAVKNAVMTIRFQQILKKQEEEFGKKSGFQYQLAG